MTAEKKGTARMFFPFFGHPFLARQLLVVFERDVIVMAGALNITGSAAQTQAAAAAADTAAPEKR